MMYEADERDDDLSSVRHRLEAHHDTGSFDLVAMVDGDEQPPALVGWLAVEWRRSDALGASAIWCSVSTPSSRAEATGGALLDAAIAEASVGDCGASSFTVMTDNVRAIHSLPAARVRGRGTQASGQRREGHLVDEYFMARLLPDR
jgi:hypothetical protein